MKKNLPKEEYEEVIASLTKEKYEKVIKEIKKEEYDYDRQELIGFAYISISEEDLNMEKFPETKRVKEILKSQYKKEDNQKC